MPSLDKYSRALDYTYALGLFPTLEALIMRPEHVRRVLLSGSIAPGQGLERILSLCTRHSIRVEEADKALARIAGKENCYAAAVVSKYSPPLGENARHLLLYQPQDRGNLGTMLRSALGFSFVDIGIISPAADVFDPHVIRASMGAAFSLHISEFETYAAYRSAFPGHTLYPFMLDGAVELGTAVLGIVKPYTLIMGNEGSGLPAWFQNEGVPVRIPHSDAIDSLNLSVAASIGMYTFKQNE